MEFTLESISNALLKSFHSVVIAVSWKIFFLLKNHMFRPNLSRINTCTGHNLGMCHSRCPGKWFPSFIPFSSQHFVIGCAGQMGSGSDDIFCPHIPWGRRKDEEQSQHHREIPGLVHQDGNGQKDRELGSSFTEGFWHFMKRLKYLVSEKITHLTFYQYCCLYDKYL